MRIVIDGRLWAETGLGRYIRNLVANLEEINTTDQYFILLLKKDYDNVIVGKNFTKVLANFRWYGISEQLNLPNLIKSLNPDLVHFPHFNVPIFYRGKFIVTIHDLIHQHFQLKRATTRDPLTYKIKKFGYHKVFHHAVCDAGKILTPSNFVKKQIIKEWGIDEQKILVTYEGVEDQFLKLAKTVTESGFKKPYLFYVGNAHPHKNLSTLISAFTKIKNKYTNLSLVLSGPDHHFWQQLKQNTKTDGIIFTGFVTEKKLIALYKGAQAFVLPSFEEGFGIPILEAMSLSCPVISSNAASLPEVGSDAAIYFNPQNVDELVAKIDQIMGDRKLAAEMIKKGLGRYQQFSWKKLAKETQAAYHATG